MISFGITAPYVELPNRVAATNAPSAVQFAGQGNWLNKSILVVDDHPDTVATNKGYIEDELFGTGVQVLGASTHQAALEIIKQWQPEKGSLFLVSDWENTRDGEPDTHAPVIQAFLEQGHDTTQLRILSGEPQEDLRRLVNAADLSELPDDVLLTKGGFSSHWRTRW